MTKESESLKFVEIDFVFEKWGIEFRKEIIQSMKDAAEEERIEKNQTLALLNLYMLRRTRDPAFDCQIYKEIFADSLFREKIRKKISRILLEIELNPDKIKDMRDSGAIYQKTMIRGLTTPQEEREHKIVVNTNSLLFHHHEYTMPQLQYRFHPLDHQ